MLHDIGRFEQIRVYHTLQDKRSIDHGDLGVMILNQQDFLSRFWKEKMDREVILQSVKYHNKLAIPKGMNERSRLFLQITKDADKIDIFRMIAEEQIPLDIKMDSFSKPVFARLLNQKPVNLLDVTTKADSLGVWLGFFYDFSFAYSRHLMEKEGWLFQLIKEYQEKAQNQELIEQLDCVKKKVLSYTKQKEEQRC